MRMVICISEQYSLISSLFGESSSPYSTHEITLANFQITNGKDRLVHCITAFTVSEANSYMLVRITPLQLLNAARRLRHMEMSKSSRSNGILFAMGYYNTPTRGIQLRFSENTGQKLTSVYFVTQNCG